MQLKMYVIYDTKIQAYDRPFFAQSDGEAERIVYQAMQDSNSNIGKYPADYNLYYAGSYDGFKGVVKSDTLVNMGTLLAIAIRWKKEAVKVQEQLKQIGENNEISDAT